jgi:hypothetical protein
VSTSEVTEWTLQYFEGDTRTLRATKICDLRKFATAESGELHGHVFPRIITARLVQQIRSVFGRGRRWL